MSIETDIVAALEQYAGLSALVGDRIYPVRFPQNLTLPGLVYYRTSSDPINHIESNSPGTINVLFSIDCRASTYAGVDSVASQVLLAMTGAAAFDALLTSRSDLSYLTGIDNYRAVLDFSVW